MAKPEGKLAMTSNNNNICWRRLFVIGGLLSFTSAFGQVLAPLSVHTAPQAALTRISHTAWAFNKNKDRLPG